MVSQGLCVLRSDGIVGRGQRMVPAVDVEVEAQVHLVKVVARDMPCPKLE